jgi:hypothetical protein
MPCYNNINIYTNGLNTNQVDSNLKKYEINKVNLHRKSPSMNRINTNITNNNSKQKIKISHSKSNSIIGKL